MAVTRLPKRLLIMDAKASTGVGTPQLVNDYKNIQIELTSQSSANFTAKIQGSFAENCPTFSSAASATNPWFYVNSWDLSDITTTGNVPGATGYSATGTDVVYGILVGVDGIRWLNVNVTDRAAGSVNASAIVYTNE